MTVSDGRNDAGESEQLPVADDTIDVTITVTDVDDPGTITLSPTQPSAGNTLTATLDDDDGVNRRGSDLGVGKLVGQKHLDSH